MDVNAVNLQRPGCEYARGQRRPAAAGSVGVCGTADDPRVPSEPFAAALDRQFTLSTAGACDTARSAAHKVSPSRVVCRLRAYCMQFRWRPFCTASQLLWSAEAAGAAAQQRTLTQMQLRRMQSSPVRWMRRTAATQRSSARTPFRTLRRCSGHTAWPTSQTCCAGELKQEEVKICLLHYHDCYACYTIMTAPATTGCSTPQQAVDDKSNDIS